MLLGSRSLLNQVVESFQMMINVVKRLEADSSHKGAEFWTCEIAWISPSVLRLLYTELLVSVFLASAESSLGS